MAHGKLLPYTQAVPEHDMWVVRQPQSKITATLHALPLLTTVSLACNCFHFKPLATRPCFPLQHL